MTVCNEVPLHDGKIVIIFTLKLYGVSTFLTSYYMNDPIPKQNYWKFITM